MATDTAVASRSVFTATVGAGSLTTLIDVCTDPVQESKARLAGDAAIRTLRVDALLTGTLQRVHTLVHICAGVSCESVTKATHTPVATWRVVTATVAAGILLALVDVLTVVLLVVVLVSGRTNTPEASSAVHTLPHRTHTWSLNTLVHILAVCSQSVQLESLITHTGVFPTWLIHTTTATAHTWSALTHTPHCLDSGRSGRRTHSRSVLLRRKFSGGSGLSIGAPRLAGGRKGVSSGCRLIGSGPG